MPRIANQIAGLDHHMLIRKMPPGLIGAQFQKTVARNADLPGQRHAVIAVVQHIRLREFAAQAIGDLAGFQRLIIGKAHQVIVISQTNETILRPRPLRFRAAGRSAIIVKPIAPAFVFGFAQQLNAVGADGF